MNLLFDLDGTLTDPALGITRCLAHACERVGARAVGVRTIALRCGYGSIDELTAAGPGWLVEQPHKLPDVVAKIDAGGGS